MKDKDYYRLLGVTPDMSSEQIKKVWLELSKIYHPDKFYGHDSKFKELNEAYQAITGSKSWYYKDIFHKNSSNTRNDKDVDTVFNKEKKSSRKEEHNHKKEKKESEKKANSASNQDKKNEDNITDTKILALPWKVVLIILGIMFLLVLFGSLANKNPKKDEISLGQTKSSINLKSTATDIFKKENSKQVVNLQKNNIPYSLQCKNKYGDFSIWNGEFLEEGLPYCTCKEGYILDDSETKCVEKPTLLKNVDYCDTQSGPNSFYNSNTNSCECKDGYYPGKISNKCVDIITERDESCEASYPGTNFLKYDEKGTRICDCKPGSYWTKDGTKCTTTYSFNSQCIQSFGSGSYATTEKNYLVCDCKYGYDFNLTQTQCVTTQSINDICTREVGRNSTYSGYVKDGKYQCTNPF